MKFSNAKIPSIQYASKNNDNHVPKVASNNLLCNFSSKMKEPKLQSLKDHAHQIWCACISHQPLLA